MRTTAHREKSAFCTKIAVFRYFTLEINATFFSPRAAILASSGQSAHESVTGPWHAGGSAAAPRYARPTVLGEKHPENGKNQPFSGLRPNPLKPTPLLYVDFRENCVLAKIHPRAVLAFSSEDAQLGPSKMTINGHFWRVSHPKMVHFGVLGSAGPSSRAYPLQTKLTTSTRYCAGQLSDRVEANKDARSA